MTQIGRYVLGRELGRGAMGVVYEAEDPLIGRVVAIKIIRLDMLTDPTAVQFLQDSLFREARSAGVLSHPNIVVVHDVGTQDNMAYIAMERVDGPTLGEILGKENRLGDKESLDISRQTAKALDYAHQSGVVHRDIKPENLMLHKGTTVKITDFGIAKLASSEHRTRTGTLLGTPSYMSPEQISAKTIDGRSDQFALAAIAFRMLTGWKAFGADTLANLVHQIVYEKRPSAREWRPDLPEAVDQVLQRGLACENADRFTTCLEFVDALQDALELGVSAQWKAPGGSTIRSSSQRLPPEPPPSPLGSDATVVMPPPAPPKSSLRGVAVGAAAVVLLGAGAYVAKVRSLWPFNAPRSSISKSQLESASEVISRGVDAPAVHEDPGAPAPKIETFDVDRKTVAAGQSVVLSWSSSNATQLRIEPELGKVESRGTRSVAVSSSTEFVLIANGPGGEVTKRIGVQVSTPAQVPVTFASDQNSISPGQSATLSWSVPGATDVQITPGMGTVASKGTQRVSPPATASYKLTAKGPFGELSRNLTITVNVLGVTEDDIRRAFGAKDFTRVKTLADAGNAVAQNFLALMYSSGSGVAKDEAQAVQWYQKSADQGYSVGQDNLGAMYSNGRGVGKDDTIAAKWFRRSADQGFARGQAHMGLMYLNGRGVPQDDAQAVAWYRKAAEQGFAQAQSDLGFMYANGRGVAKDDAQAVAWYQKSADQGDSTGQNRLGIMYANGRGVTADDGAAFSWYKKSAEQGNAGAEDSLGSMYRTGRGTARDDQKAVEWFKKAADLGYAPGELHLASMYEAGRAVPQDDVQAAAWYRKAADQGQPDAEAGLAAMYRDGRGVPKDDAQSVEWSRKAADQNHARGLNELGFMYENGRGVPKDVDRAVSLYRRSADLGFAVGQSNLGHMYETGRGVTRDDAQAAIWFRKAADQDYEQAEFALGGLYEHGLGVPKNVDQAIIWYRKAASHGNQNAQEALRRLKADK